MVWAAETGALGDGLGQMLVFWVALSSTLVTVLSLLPTSVRDERIEFTPRPVSELAQDASDLFATMLSPTDPRRPTNSSEPEEVPLGCSCVVLLFYAFAAVGVIGLLLIGWRAIF